VTSVTFLPDTVMLTWTGPQRVCATEPSTVFTAEVGSGAALVFGAALALGCGAGEESTGPVAGVTMAVPPPAPIVLVL
jgi:hypothetical protein